MTAQTKQHKWHSKLSMRNDTSKSSSQQMKLFNIAVQMKKSGLSDLFIVSAVRLALEYEGVCDLMNLWMNEKNKIEKEEIIADIQEMIDACSQKENVQATYIKFNDLEEIAKNIRGFKDSLYQIAMERGGISKLANLTGIPQPSLSRFFNSNAMPRRATVLAIAKALDLNGIAIDVKWGG